MFTTSPKTAIKLGWWETKTMKTITDDDVRLIETVRRQRTNDVRYCMKYPSPADFEAASQSVSASKFFAVRTMKAHNLNDVAGERFINRLNLTDTVEETLALVRELITQPLTAEQDDE